MPSRLDLVADTVLEAATASDYSPEEAQELRRHVSPSLHEVVRHYAEKYLPGESQFDADIFSRQVKALAGDVMHYAPPRLEPAENAREAYKSQLIERLAEAVKTSFEQRFGAEPARDSAVERLASGRKSAGARSVQT